VIHSFTAALTFGAVLVGSYTSIFIAAPILIYLGVGQGREMGGGDAPDEDDAVVSAKAAKRPAPAKR
jgi:preprotein translocase subunit SecF